jgi:hypothetical protein
MLDPQPQSAKPLLYYLGTAVRVEGRDAVVVHHRRRSHNNETWDHYRVQYSPPDARWQYLGADAEVSDWLDVSCLEPARPAPVHVLSKHFRQPELPDYGRLAYAAHTATMDRYTAWDHLAPTQQARWQRIAAAIRTAVLQEQYP